jgi:hypothetical protein
MHAFLTEVKKTTYGPVLAEIDAFVTEIVKEDDREINNTKDSFKNLVEQSRETDEKAITDWFDTVKNKLKPKILYARRKPVTVKGRTNIIIAPGPINQSEHTLPPTPSSILPISRSLSKETPNALKQQQLSINKSTTTSSPNSLTSSEA